MSRGELLGRAAHLAGLWGLAVVPPCSACSGTGPSSLTARGATGREIVAFAIGAALVPPLLMLALELLAGLASASLAWALQLGIRGRRWSR